MTVKFLETLSAYCLQGFRNPVSYSVLDALRGRSVPGLEKGLIDDYNAAATSAGRHAVRSAQEYIEGCGR